MLFDLG